MEKVNQDQKLTDVYSIVKYWIFFLNEQETLNSFDNSGTIHKVVEVWHSWHRVAFPLESL